MIDDARLGGFFETSHSHQQHNYHQSHQEENLINNAGGCFVTITSIIAVLCQLLSGSGILTGHKERRDSTDSDKENEFESLIQFPDNSNVLNLLPQVHKEKFFRNEESAIDSVRNIGESYAEENIKTTVVFVLDFIFCMAAALMSWTSDEVVFVCVGSFFLTCSDHTA